MTDFAMYNFILWPPPCQPDTLSALLLNLYHKKQENHAAIFNRFSVDAANNALKALVNFIPLIVI